MPAVANPPPRRSQAQRSAATREALLDATIACLAEDGYANTTTSRVAERAGVSRGAHLHHFQTRSALVAAAMESLAERRGAALLAAAKELPAGRERLEQGLDLLWAGYAGPLYQAALDLWTHARTDEELRERLVPVERGLDHQTSRITRQLFPELADRAGFDRMVEMAAATMRGLALLETLHPGSGRNRKQWAYSRARLVELFESLPSEIGIEGGVDKRGERAPAPAGVGTIERQHSGEVIDLVLEQARLDPFGIQQHLAALSAVTRQPDGGAALN